jgi:hypothetical protein
VVNVGSATVIARRSRPTMIWPMQTLNKISREARRLDCSFIASA